MGADCLKCAYHAVEPDSLFCRKCLDMMAGQLPLFTSLGSLRPVERVEARTEYI